MVFTTLQGFSIGKLLQLYLETRLVMLAMFVLFNKARVMKIGTDCQRLKMF